MAARTSGSYAQDKELLLTRMNKIEGQVRGIRKMIEDDRYCADVLQQIAALKSAADSVALILLEDHLKGCTAEAIRHGNGEEHIKEVVETVRRFVRTTS
jgi:CsoR family transcriptional regulator, copper-sensing transcriptional repressor